VGRLALGVADDDAVGRALPGRRDLPLDLGDGPLACGPGGGAEDGPVDGHAFVVHSVEWLERDVVGTDEAARAEEQGRVADLLHAAEPARLVGDDEGNVGRREAGLGDLRGGVGRAQVVGAEAGGGRWGRRTARR
jgi:hypothetical protein